MAKKVPIVTGRECAVLGCIYEAYQKAILPEAEFVSPTYLGVKVWGRKRHSASSTASPVCLRLVKKGLLHRSYRGHYKLTSKGLAFIEVFKADILD